MDTDCDLLVEGSAKPKRGGKAAATGKATGDKEKGGETLSPATQPTPTIPEPTGTSEPQPELELEMEPGAGASVGIDSKAAVGEPEPESSAVSLRAMLMRGSLLGESNPGPEAGAGSIVEEDAIDNPCASVHNSVRAAEQNSDTHSQL
jgi:hypothetical protein